MSRTIDLDPEGMNRGGMDPGNMDRAGCDRREFIGAAGAVAALVPAASLIAWPAGAAVAAPERLTDWTIDDMWGVYTRYAEPIPCGHTLDPRDLAADPLDALLSA